MQSEEITVDLSDLVEFITATVKDLVENRMFPEGAGNDALSEQIARQMIRILRKSLQSEREEYLQNLLQKLDQINEDRADLEAEFNRTRHYNHRQTQKLTIENQTLKQQYEELASKVEATEWRHARKEKMAKEALRRKEEAVATLHAVIDETESAYAHLHHDIEGLRLAAAKMQRIEQKLIHQAREMCTDELRRMVRDTKSTQQKVHSRRVARLQAAIEAEKKEQLRLEHACEAVLDGIWAVAPDGVEHPDVSVKDFPKRVTELRDFVLKTIEKEKKRANREFIAEINKEIDGIEFDHSEETLGQAVERYIEEKVRAKQAECEDVLRSGAEREERLRAKLAKTRAKIQRLQGKGDSDDLEVSELSKQQSEWVQQKEKLDGTMESLEQSRDENSTLMSKTLTILQYSDSD